MKKIHFIGIGGIGISALARFLKEKGFDISGSDLKESKTTMELEKQGIKVSIPHKAKNVLNKDLVIYSAAIKEENVEFKEAKKLGIQCLSRKEALPMILKDKKVLAVAGAHGKSTTSSILASLLDESSVIIGAILKNFGSNMIYKANDKLIFEADESDSSFLNSNPHLAIVTNTEAEHLEHYDNDLKKLQKAYYDFLKQAKIRVVNAEDEYLANLDLDCIKLYPSKDIKDCKTVIKDYKPHTSFKLKDYGEFHILGIGNHLAIDAALAILAAKEYKSIDEIKANLQSYMGIKKRFDIFEPHRYTRLLANLNEFKEAFKDVDELIILPVYAAGEKEIDINLKEHFKKAIFINDLKREGKYLVANDGRVFDEGLIIGFGAGDISNKLR